MTWFPRCQLASGSLCWPIAAHLDSKLKVEVSQTSGLAQQRNPTIHNRKIRQVWSEAFLFHFYRGIVGFARAVPATEYVVEVDSQTISNPPHFILGFYWQSNIFLVTRDIKTQTPVRQRCLVHVHNSHSFGMLGTNNGWRRVSQLEQKPTW